LKQPIEFGRIAFYNRLKLDRLHFVSVESLLKLYCNNHALAVATKFLAP